MGSSASKNRASAGGDQKGAILDSIEAQRLLLAIYSVAAGSSLLIALLGILTHSPRIGVLGAVPAIFFGLLLLLVRTKRVSLAGILGTALLLAIVIVASVTGHGARDLSFAACPFAMLVANLVLDRPKARVATFLAWSTPVGLAAAEVLGLYHNELSFKTSPTSVGIIAALYLAIALAVQRLTNAFHEGLNRARIQELSYRHIFNATGEAIFLIDPDKKLVLDVNQSALTMFGYSRKELLRFSLQQLTGKHQTESQIEEIMTAGMRGQPTLFEWTATTKFGNSLPVEVSLRPATVGEREVLLAVIRDATEMRRLQDKLRESEKLQAVGQLAGGIAHDFNNQLTGILANASLLHDRLTDERWKKCAEVIVRCSQRSSDLTSQLLAFARRGKHQNVVVDLHELIGEVVELLKHTIDKRITLKTQLCDHDLKVQGDPTLLQNAFLNLGLNACDAMPQGGTLTFQIDRNILEVTRTGLATDMFHGDYARIIVRDTGEGMDEATQRRVFEPFFTTKKTGNGMGLAAVYGAVESHKGDISLESRPGHGSVFTILLPACDHSLDSVSLKTIAPLSTFEGTRVLVAEDEEDVATSTLLLLRELGCEVVRCADGQEAVDLFRKTPDDFELVLVDHMMPRLSGRESLKEMRRLRPQLRAIITSGYSNQTVIENDNDLANFLPKPFNLEQLSRIMARALDSAANS